MIFFFFMFFKLCGLHPVKQFKWHHCDMDRGLAMDCTFVCVYVHKSRAIET